MNLLEVSMIVYLLNIPFGYWRANVERLSRQWFIAIHVPVILVIAIRFLSGLGWALITFPALVGAFFLGQLSGGFLNKILRHKVGLETSSCLFMDVVRMGNG